MTSKKGANGSGLAVRTGPPPKTIGSLFDLSWLHNGIWLLYNRSKSTGPSSSLLKEKPNRSILRSGVSYWSINTLLISTSFLWDSIAHISWNPRFVIPTEYVFGKAKVVLSALLSGIVGLKSSVSCFSVD